jgi:hypothetical protein
MGDLVLWAPSPTAMNPRQPHSAVDARVGHTQLDTMGHLLALHVTAADEQDRAQVMRLAVEVQRITEEKVELVLVDQG